ncbi:MAG: sugar phosphate nucleotidyltransferase [Pikeienuella sp.]
MTNAVLLSAGQGRRLSPLTDDRPKCTIQIGDKALVEWQIRALLANGIEDISIVTGFRADMIKQVLDDANLPINIRYIYNPFYSVADNIGSCWMARDHLGSDSLLINGDTLIDPRIIARVLERAPVGEGAPINVTMDRKGDYDSDDMKVRLNGNQLTDIGKTLTAPIDGESIGMLRFRDEGGAMFVNTLEDILSDVTALKLWYLSIIDRIAKTGKVGFVDIDGLPWAEVDFPQDLDVAAAQVASFQFP